MVSCGNARAILAHRYLFAASHTSIRTTAGESGSNCRHLPLSVITILASCTVRSSLMHIATRAAIGPWTLYHCSPPFTTLIFSLQTAASNVSASIQWFQIFIAQKPNTCVCVLQMLDLLCPGGPVRHYQGQFDVLASRDAWWGYNCRYDRLWSISKFGATPVANCP